jgi:hypothetical protein
MVVNLILKTYKNVNDLESLDSLDRLSKVKVLMRLFEDVPHKKKIQIILEEIPTSSVKNMNKWLSNVIIQHKYAFLSNIIDENNKEFVFSQNAFIINGIKTIPVKLIKYHKALPLEWLDSTIDIKIEGKRNDYSHNQDADIKNLEMALDSDEEEGNKSDKLNSPSVLEGKYEKLGTKWVMHKKSKWINMVYIKSEYTKNSLPEFVNWFAKKLGLRLTYDDVLVAAKQKHYDILDDKELMLYILQDQSYFHQWQKAIKRKFSTVQLFWDNFYEDLSREKRQKYLSIVLNEELYPNDLHIVAISKLLNVSILTIHRGKYGKFDTAENARGDIGDLIISSTLYPAENNLDSRPLIIFNKVNEKSFTGYYLVVEKDMKQIYMKYSELPNNIKMLTDAHLQV